MEQWLRWPLVAAEIVQHHNIAGRQGWGEDLFHIDGEELAVDRSVDHPRRINAIMAQGGDEGLGLPVSEGGIGFQASPSRSPAPQGRHIGFDPCFINEDQPFKGDAALVSFPAVAFARHVRPRLFLGKQGFF